MSVSVVIPVFNVERFLEKTFASVFEQTIQAGEVILVDDCSTDYSWEVVQKLQESYPELIKSTRLQQNSGPGIARNKGVEMATKDYVAFLDGDDLWKPDKLFEQLKFMRENDLDFSYCSYEVLSERGNKRTVLAPKGLEFEELLHENPIGTSSVMVRRDLISQQGFPDLKRRQDWACWLGLLRTGCRFGGLSEVLVTYRERMESLSRSGVRFERKLPMLVKYRWKVYDWVGVNYAKRFGLIVSFVWRAYVNKFRKVFKG